VRDHTSQARRYRHMADPNARTVPTLVPRGLVAANLFQSASDGAKMAV
jgi:hypothetical protein